MNSHILLLCEGKKQGTDKQFIETFLFIQNR